MVFDINHRTVLACTSTYTLMVEKISATAKVFRYTAPNERT